MRFGIGTMVAAAGFAAAMIFGGAASAAVIDSDETCSLIDVTPNADACWGSADVTGNLGNDSESVLNDNAFLKDGNDDVNVLGLFNVTDWDFAQKQGTPGALETDIDVGLVVSPTTGTTSGSWSLDDSKVSMYEQVLVVLKAGSTFAAYLYDTPLVSSAGTWNTDALLNPQGDPQGLSHLSVYVRGDVNVVPLPAAAWMLLAGLGGLAAMRRRKKS